MLDPRFTLAEPLFKQYVPRSGRDGRRTFKCIFATIASSLALVFSRLHFAHNGHRLVVLDLLAQSVTGAKRKRKADEVGSILASFVSGEDGQPLGQSMDLPLSTTPEQLNLILNSILKNAERRNYNFQIRGEPFEESSLADHGGIAEEDSFVDITYTAQGVFRVQLAARCTATMAGHTDAVLTAAFSPDGRKLCSGSGDATVRFWDLVTSTPDKEGTDAHRGWVLALAWSPDGVYVASGGMDKRLCVWKGASRKLVAMFRGHRSWIASIDWEPCHLAYPCNRLVSGCDDCVVRVFNLRTNRTDFKMEGHTRTVQKVCWGGDNLIYSASADFTIKIWSAKDGQMLKEIAIHVGKVNTLSLSTNHVLRTGIFDHMTGDNALKMDPKSAFAFAQRRYKKHTDSLPERLASGSDDKTLFLWRQGGGDGQRMIGHKKSINHVSFSPNGLLLCSAAFDDTVLVWHGYTGHLIAQLHGHAAPVYLCSWSPDSQFMISSSKDSTLKAWDMSRYKFEKDLGEHKGEVFAIDWSPDGSTVASGGQDTRVRLWKH